MYTIVGHEFVFKQTHEPQWECNCNLAGQFAQILILISPIFLRELTTAVACNSLIQFKSHKDKNRKIIGQLIRL
jgi:hypothetical protein